MKLAYIMLSAFVALLVSIFIATLLGSGGRGMFTTLQLIAPALLLVHGWFWSSRATMREVLISLVIFTLSVFLVYGNFSGSFIPTKDSLMLLALYAIPSAAGFLVQKAVRKYLLVA